MHSQRPAAIDSVWQSDASTTRRSSSALVVTLAFVTASLRDFTCGRAGMPVAADSGGLPAGDEAEGGDTVARKGARVTQIPAAPSITTPITAPIAIARR